MPPPPDALLDPALTPVWREAQRLPTHPGPGELEHCYRRAQAVGADGETTRAVISQVMLRRDAADKLGVVADGLLLSRTGLQQASRPIVAGHRAARLAAAGRRSFTDLGCGLGIDSLAAARAGLAVVAVEQHPTVAALARWNLRDRRSARVVVGDAIAMPVDEDSVAFVDPGRRTGWRADGSARRTTDPAHWQPPWPWVLGLGDRHPATVAKLAPGVPHDVIPAGCEVEWVSVAGDLVEATVWFPGLTDTPDRRSAVLLTPGADPWVPAARHRLTGSTDSAPDGPLGPWLLEPDPAVIRAHLIAALCERVRGRTTSPGLAYVTTDERPQTPFARAWHVQDVLPADVRGLRAALRAKGVGSVEIRTRGLDLDPARLRRDLRLRGAGAPAHLAVTRVQGRPVALLLGDAG